MSIFSTHVGARSSRRFSLGTVFASGALACLLAASPASAHPQGDDLNDVFGDRAPSAADVYLDSVELHPGVTADIHLRVLSNPRPGCGQKTIVAVPGAACSASTLESLGQAILATGNDHDHDGDDDDHGGGERACRFISIDLPGHGESSLPTGTLFGDLSLQDYAAAVLGTLDRLQDNGIDTTTLVGHSMGGLVVVLAQQSRVVDEGSSLRDANGVKHVVLLSPSAFPQGVPCAICQNPQLAALFGAFESVSPVLGPVLQLPAPVYPALAWSRPDGTLATDAPTPAEVTALGWASVESLTALAANLDVPVPPTIGTGIFDNHYGTKLNIVSFQNDSIVRPEEGEALFQYLTGNGPESGWTTVEGANAVHGTPITDAAGTLAALPAGMLDALEGRSRSSD